MPRQRLPCLVLPPFFVVAAALEVHCSSLPLSPVPGPFAQRRQEWIVPFTENLQFFLSHAPLFRVFPVPTRCPKHLLSSYFSQPPPATTGAQAASWSSVLVSKEKEPFQGHGPKEKTVPFDYPPGSLPTPSPNSLMPPRVNCSPIPPPPPPKSFLRSASVRCSLSSIELAPREGTLRRSMANSKRSANTFNTHPPSIEAV